jgi:nucleoside phosphorylase
MNVFRAAILTAKEVEFDAVREHLVDERRVDDTFDGTVYRRAKIRREPSSDIPIEHWEIAIYRTGRGQQPTTYGTQILMQHFRPDIVLYVGVAGGDPSHLELTLGDVVVGKLIRYYERTSQHADSFVIKDEHHSPNRALVSAAEYEADENNWLNRITGERPNSQVFVEEIASGEKVQKSASSALWTAIKTRYPDVIAVETEGQGFHYAVSQSGGRGLMVRAISDLLDNKDDDSGEYGRDDDRQALASKHAAAFAINLIANLNTKFLEEIRPSAAFRYAVIIKISADTIEGVHRATRLFADAINDPHLTVESLQPSNSFLLRIHTTLHSAAYARAVFRGGFISALLGAEVSALESDVERTGEPVFDSFLSAVSSGNADEIIHDDDMLAILTPKKVFATLLPNEPICPALRAMDCLAFCLLSDQNPRGVCPRRQEGRNLGEEVPQRAALGG